MRNYWLHINPKEAVVIADQIEREVLIEAPVEAVWSAITEPEQIIQWFTDEAELDARPGGEGRLKWDKRAGRSGGWETRVSVVSVDPPRSLAWRWTHPDGVSADEANSLLVEFTLMPDGDFTRLRLVESGLSGIDWDEERKRAYFDDHSQGWTHFGEQLGEFVASGVSAAR